MYNYAALVYLQAPDVWRSAATNSSQTQTKEKPAHLAVAGLWSMNCLAESRVAELQFAQHAHSVAAGIPNIVVALFVFAPEALRVNPVAQGFAPLRNITSN
jgi:hypothetical protein